MCKVFDKFVDYSGNSDDSETLSINEKPSKTDSLKDKTSTIFQIVAILRNTATIAIFSAWTINFRETHRRTNGSEENFQDKYHMEKYIHVFLKCKLQNQALQNLQAILA